MQSLYKIIKSPETNGNEIISLPDFRLMHEKKQKISDSDPDKSTEIYDEVLSSAKKKAEVMLREAEASAKSLMEETNQKVEKTLNEAREDGYQQGYKAGYKDGYQYGIDEAVSEADETRKNADIYLTSCQLEVEAYIKNKQQEIMQLSITIAKQIINSEIMINPDIVNKISEKVLSQATDRKHVILKVNPADFNIVKSKKDDLSIYVENPNNLFIIADSSVTQGSIKAETPSGFIDGDIDTQLDMIAKILLRN